MLIDILKASINQIPERSYMVTNPTSHTVAGDPDYSQVQVYPEINYVSDLKVGLVQLSNFAEENLLVQVEIYKEFHGRYFDEDAFNESKRQLLPNHRGVRPDLIIHEDQANQLNQALALECKISPDLSYAEFCVDLFKLMIYKEIFGFRLLVYVIGNNRPDDIGSYYFRYAQEYYLNDQNLHVLLKERFGVPIFCVIHGENGC